MFDEDALRILLIDDEPRFIEDILSAYGYPVETALDGLAGMQKLLSDPGAYDLVLLDVCMPVMDGWAVLKAIRSDGKTQHLPVVMLTNMTDEDALVAGLRRGADEYLTKPITPKRLLAHLEVVARRVRYQRQLSQHTENGGGGSSQDVLKLLTPRECELLRYVVQGHSNQQIAAALSISETTVKSHLAHVFKKLQVANRTQAAFLAQKLNLFK